MNKQYLKKCFQCEELKPYNIFKNRGRFICSDCREGEDGEDLKTVEGKICTGCGDFKSLEDFHKQKKGKYGRRAKCKECILKYIKDYQQRPEIKLKIKKYKKDYQQRPEIKQKKREYHQRPEVIQHRKEYLKRPEIIQRNKEYYAKPEVRQRTKESRWKPENKQHKKEYSTKYNKEYSKKIKNKIKRKNRRKKQSKDPLFKLRNIISTFMYKGLKSVNLNKPTEGSMLYINYTMIQLKQHIESQFEAWMNWENQGATIKGKWQIDHIIPQTVYDWTDEEEIRKCWDLRNLRPLCAIENTSKKNNLDLDLIVKYQIEDLLPKELNNISYNEPI